jgi:hypothetical protein
MFLEMLLNQVQYGSHLTASIVRELKADWRLTTNLAAESTRSATSSGLHYKTPLFGEDEDYFAIYLKYNTISLKNISTVNNTLAAKAAESH